MGECARSQRDCRGSRPPVPRARAFSMKRPPNSARQNLENIQARRTRRATRPSMALQAPGLPIIGPDRLPTLRRVPSSSARHATDRLQHQPRTDRLEVAKKIAACSQAQQRRIQFRQGRRASGSKTADIVQVSMNLTNYEQTSMFRRIRGGAKREAARHGVNGAGERDIVGSVPAAALQATGKLDCSSRGFGRANRCSKQTPRS